MTAPAILRHLFVGALVALVALALAVLAVGPALRSIVGSPPGFGSDYTSPTAYLQAVVAQCISMAVSFLIVGMVARRQATAGGWRWALWMANPLTVGIAYWLIRQIRSVDWPYEYTAYHGWLLLSFVSPLLFAPCVYLGARLARMHI
jgi:hypothetical protein